MNIMIRKADVYHAEMIALIGKISFRHAFGDVFNESNLEEYLSTAYNPDKIAATIDMEDTIYYVAETDKRPVGFAKLKKFSLNDAIESVNQMQLEKIYVLPEFHSSGAGTGLLNEVISQVNELSPDYLWLDVYTGNEKAIRFYERNGFKKENTYHQGFGTQFFEFNMMVLPIAVTEPLFCH